MEGHKGEFGGRKGEGEMMKLYYNVKNESKKGSDVRFLTTVGIIIHTPTQPNVLVFWQ